MLEIDDQSAEEEVTVADCSCKLDLLLVWNLEELNGPLEVEYALDEDR